MKRDDGFLVEREIVTPTANDYDGFRVWRKYKKKFIAELNETIIDDDETN